MSNALPPDTPEGPHPEHPIVLPDEETPIVDEEALDFFQRVTVGFNWNPSSVGTEGEQVGVDAINADSGGDWTNVRTVPNSGSSSVTYPAGFTGDVSIRVRGSAGTVPGDYTVT